MAAYSSTNRRLADPEVNTPPVPKAVVERHNIAFNISNYAPANEKALYDLVYQYNPAWPGDTIVRDMTLDILGDDKPCVSFYSGFPVRVKEDRQWILSELKKLQQLVSSLNDHSCVCEIEFYEDEYKHRRIYRLTDTDNITVIDHTLPEESTRYTASSAALYKSDNWEFFSYTYGEGMRASILFDTEAVSYKGKDYNTCVRLIMHINQGNCLEDGLPTQMEWAEISDVDEFMQEDIQSNSWYVARMIYSGMVDFVFQTDEPKKLIAELEKTKHSIFTIYRTEILQSAGWDFFNNNVAPGEIDWQMITDSKLIRQLLDTGADPDKEYTLNHTIMGPHDKLNEFWSIIEKDGYAKVSLTENKLVVSRPSRLHLFEISAITQEFASFCPKQGLCYDGWGTFITN